MLKPLIIIVSIIASMAFIAYKIEDKDKAFEPCPTCITKLDTLKVINHYCKEVKGVR